VPASCDQLLPWTAPARQIIPYPVSYLRSSPCHTRSLKRQSSSIACGAYAVKLKHWRAVTGEEGCAAVLHLIVAARGGINGLMAEVIEDHIRMHVVDPAKDTERRRGAEELIEAVQSYLK